MRGWWADDTITDNEFLNGIQHLIKIGIVNVPITGEQSLQLPQTDDSKLASLETELEKCSEIKCA